ncbi:MAG: GerMN domain-containing protein [Treponema sp.]|nr:GerMN domain-containing protein [Treponema sp.]
MAGARSGGLDENGSRRAKNLSKTLLFWLVFGVFVIGLFIANWEKIQTTLRNTGVAERLIQNRNQEAHAAAERPAEPEAPVEQIEALEIPAEQVEAFAAPGEENSREGMVSEPMPADAYPLESAGKAAAQALADEADAVAGAAASRGEAGGQGPAVSVPPTPAENAPPAQPQGRTAAFNAAGGHPAAEDAAPLHAHSFYFMRLDQNGSIVQTRVTRMLRLTATPLTDVLQALLRGPTNEENNQGLISLIPPGTRVLSAKVLDRTAYINFSEDFLFNIYGAEGFAAQLRQILWTITELPAIRDMQVLIEGRRYDYLGEKVWIGSPLSRDSGGR